MESLARQIKLLFSKRRATVALCTLLIVYCSSIQALDLGSEPISPLQPNLALNPAKIALGRVLFHDPRLSSDNSISCASCHNLSLGGADTGAISFGVNQAAGSANTPTVYNSSLNFVQFWNGRARDLNEQVSGPVHNPVEMNSNWLEIINRLSQDKPLTEQFKIAYIDGISIENIQDAIIQFEHSLVTLNAPFDRWITGDSTALSETQIQGYRLFKSYGCISCHQGRNVGGNMYAYFGAVTDISAYFRDRGTAINETDLGRYTDTHNPADRYLFKVPSLRLASLTPPYFHDGSIAQLSDAITIMGRFQLGRDIPKEHVSAIQAFIESLAGEHPELAK
ncbi:cytochrome-c peroxidase [Amphritea japonica]|uniref:Methylamine utilization protein MauG n=1 Tax=Amphritea japonica ATCC BAA-1530 TaxID=1278309 RepID=A0A7R6P4K4_9GAMM|nr:cytochrome c peroxidase [Amphritea japonica]BBB27198.1 methylamine utilization protein MauG [Amphritea japonica ATCC BAA-1530]